MAAPSSGAPPEDTPAGALRTLALYFATTGRILVDPLVWPSLLVIVLWLGIGTVAYMFFEGWRGLDALYFSTVTLATVGFGDVAPQTDAGKIFTILYILIGVGTLAMLLNGIVHRRLELIHLREGKRKPVPVSLSDDDELV